MKPGLTEPSAEPAREDGSQRVDRPTPRKWLVWFGLISLCFLANVWLAFRNTQAAEVAARRATHAHEVRFELATLLSALKDAETGQRGFLVTGNDTYLEPYRQATGELGRRLTEVSRLTADEPEQQSDLKEVRELVDRKLAELQETIALRRDGGLAAAQPVVMTNGGKRTMDALRGVIDDMDDREQALIAAQGREVVASERAATATTLASLAFGLALLVIFFAIRRAFAVRQRVTEAVSRERERLRTTLLSISEGVIVVDAAGRVELMNAEAHTLTGWGEDALGRSFEEVFHTVKTATKQRGGSPVDDVRRVGSVFGVGRQTMLIARDGTEVCVNHSGGPIRDAHGSVIGLVLVFRDARKEQRADEAERSYARLLQFSPDAIFSWRLDDGIETWNKSAEQLFGFSGKEARGQNPHELLQTEPPLSWAEIEAVMRNHGRWDGELVQRTKDGRKLTVSARLQLTRDADGIDRVLESNSDVTERKHAAEELEMANAELLEADRSKNQFLSMLAHELRNPLAPIQNSLYILDHVEPGDERARRAQMVIRRQVAHMTRIVDDLLDVARISRGLIQLQREWMDFGTVVGAAVEDHRVAFETNGVDLQVSIPAEPIRICGDRARVTQVIQNLLGNAAKFTPRGGSVIVTVETNEQLRQAVVRVRDTGLGIAPEVLPRLYGPFIQADTTLDRSKGGLGLGLSLIKAIAELHGGSVSVESEGVGKGAEFTVRFPLETGLSRTTTPVLDARQGATGRRVLVIEDNVDAAETLRAALEFDAHTVEVAFSGAEGLEKARVFRPEIIFCDLGLPGMDGYEVAKALRAEPAQKSVTLVALTGYAAAADRARSRQAGFNHHVAKPASMAAIQQILAINSSVAGGQSKTIDATG